MKTNFFVLGGGLDTKLILKEFSKFGKIILLDRNKKCPAKKYSDFFHNVDLKDEKKILKIFYNYKNIKKNLVVFTYNSEPFVLKIFNKITQHKFDLELLLNKKKTYKRINKNILIPKIVDQIKKGVKYIRKPFFESNNSKDVSIISTNKKKNKNFIFQEFIEGQEYNASIIVQNNIVTIYNIVKKFRKINSNKISQKGVEIDKNYDKNVLKTANILQKIFKFNNCFFNFDYIINNKKIYLIDVGYNLDKHIISFFKINEKNFLNLFYRILTNKKFRIVKKKFKIKKIEFKQYKPYLNK